MKLIKFIPLLYNSDLVKTLMFCNLQTVNNSCSLNESYLTLLNIFVIYGLPIYIMRTTFLYLKKPVGVLKQEGGHTNTNSQIM